MQNVSILHARFSRIVFPNASYFRLCCISKDVIDPRSGVCLSEVMWGMNQSGISQGGIIMLVSRISWPREHSSPLKSFIVTISQNVPLTITQAPRLEYFVVASLWSSFNYKSRSHNAFLRYFPHLQNIQYTLRWILLLLNNKFYYKVTIINLK